MSNMGTLVLGFRLGQNEFHRYEIDNVDLDVRVDEFKDRVVKYCKVEKDLLGEECFVRLCSFTFIVSELIYCGVILQNEKSLSAFGIKNGVMIHVFKKKTPKCVVPETSLYDDQIEIIVHDINIFKSSYAYMSGLQVTLSKIYCIAIFCCHTYKLFRSESQEQIH